MSKQFTMGGASYCPGKCLIIAELSANHNGSLDRAIELVRAARRSGADAVKVQTYTADSMTLQSDRPEFQIEGTIWDGKNLHDLYGEAAMPWDWQPELQKICREEGLHFFSSPFDFAAVDYLEELDVPAYKIASFELVDLPLIAKAAATGKPLIISTGMGTLSEIEDAVKTARKAGCNDIALLKCTSAYPSPASQMNLRTIPHLANTFGTASGLSDHTLGIAVPVTASALGASVIEKHFTLSRSDGGVDSAFSLEPTEFAEMVTAVRTAEEALGQVQYGGVDSESETRKYRRSLYVVEDVEAGEEFTAQNIRSLRPDYGLSPKHYEEVLGRKAAVDISKGTPMSFDFLAAES